VPSKSNTEVYDANFSAVRTTAAASAREMRDRQIRDLKALKYLEETGNTHIVVEALGLDGLLTPRQRYRLRELLPERGGEG